jgi:hypothetical protein
MTMRQRFQWTFVAALTLAGCAGDIGGDDGDGSGSDDDPIVCEQTRTYTGFGSRDLTGTRPAIDPGSDRLRLKPFVALSAEYRAALGLAAFDTGMYAATFGRPPARWFQEPAASANTVYAAFALAFDACTRQTMGDARYAAAPDAASADVNCREYARRAWHREATDAEAAACVSYAVDKTNPADAPAKRWSYACAAVLSASGFLAY